MQINTLCLIQFRAEPAEGLKIKIWGAISNISFYGTGFAIFSKWVEGTLCRTEVLHVHLLGIKYGVHFYQILIVFEVPSKGCLEVAKNT